MFFCDVGCAHRSHAHRVIPMRAMGAVTPPILAPTPTASTRSRASAEREVLGTRRRLRHQHHRQLPPEPRGPAVQPRRRGTPGKGPRPARRRPAQPGNPLIIGRKIGEVFNPVVGGPDQIKNLESSVNTKYDGLLVSARRGDSARGIGCGRPTRLRDTVDRGRHPHHAEGPRAASLGGLRRPRNPADHAHCLLVQLHQPGGRCARCGQGVAALHTARRIERRGRHSRRLPTPLSSG